MKALMLKEYGRLEYADCPPPAVGPGDVRVAVRACGICGSDVHGMDGSTGRRKPPLIMGHEAAGTVVEVGPGVSDWRQGDRVTFDSTLSCGACRFCRAGRVNLCRDRQVLGVSCGDYRRDGAMAEFVVVPDRALYRLPEGLSFERAALAEPLSVAIHAVGRANLLPGASAAVIGTGVIGLLAVQALRAAGARTIIAADVDPTRLDLAAALGADACLRADEADVPSEVARMTGGQGADAAFEAVGVAPAVRTAVGSIRRGGTVVLIGNVAPAVELPLQAVVTRELTLYGSCASAGEYPACLDLLASGRVNVDALISRVVPLAEGAEWFRRLHDGGSGLMKVILKP